MMPLFAVSPIAGFSRRAWVTFIAVLVIMKSSIVRWIETK